MAYSDYHDELYPSDVEESDVQSYSDSDLSDVSATETLFIKTFDTTSNRRDAKTERLGLMADPDHHGEGHNHRLVD